MGAPLLRKACLATALLSLALVPSGNACPSGNADDGTAPSLGGAPCPIDVVGVQEPCAAPCPIVVVGLEHPIVDVHPECIDD